MKAYLGMIIWPFKPEFEVVQTAELDDTTYASVGQGTFTPWKQTTGPRRALTLPFHLVSVREIKAFRNFVSILRGRSESFWLPYWLNDYRLVQDQDLGDTTITVVRSGLAAAVAGFEQFTQLCLIPSDLGSAEDIECHGIKQVDLSGETEVITLMEPLLSDVVADKPTICCPLLKARLGSDQVTYEYQSDSVASVLLQFLETPGEYDARPASQSPVMLYEFLRSGQTWRLANWGIDLDADGHTWTAANVTNGTIRSTLEMFSDSVELLLKTDDMAHFMRYYARSTAIDRTQVWIRRYDRINGGGSELIYFGDLTDVKYEPEGLIRCQLSSIMRMAEDEFPRVQIKRLCNHRLFDTGCGLTADPDYLTSGLVSATGECYVEATAFGDAATAHSDPNWFAYGKVMLGTQTRLVTGQAGNRLYLNANFSGTVTVGAGVTALPGCSKRVTVCVSKFKNLEHFLGFPYIPNENPQFVALTNPTAGGGKKS